MANDLKVNAYKTLAPPSTALPPLIFRLSMSLCYQRVIGFLDELGPVASELSEIQILEQVGGWEGRGYGNVKCGISIIELSSLRGRN